MKFKQELEEKQLILLVLLSQKFCGTMIELVKQFNGQKILYVTLNNPYSALMKLHKENGIKTDKSFFIDCISTKTKTESPAPNCVFVSSPQALTQLSIAITQSIKMFEPEIMIFDSLSTLMIYLPINTVIAFCQSLSTKIKNTSVKVVFPVINNKELIENISMFVDDVIEWKD